METPTPVSALMHAGIVNAGGYLMIRTSPLVSLAPHSLTFLAMVGGLTACFGAVVMLSQNSIKKSLAYSTIAQMGFMMLQCGLGAYSAAMLHILAHSLYKAHAFLSSGSVMAHRAAVGSTRQPSGSPDWTKVLITCAVIAGMLGASFATVGVDVSEKPGGLLLGGVVCLALTYWVSLSIQTGSHSLLAWSLIIAGALCLTYAGSFAAIDSIVSSSLPAETVNLGDWLVIAIVGFGFVGMYLLQAMLSSMRPRRRWVNALYVHASNGFYLEKSHFQIARE